MKSIFFVTLFALALSPYATAIGMEDTLSETKVKNLRAAVDSACKVPEVRSNYSVYSYDRFLRQTVAPELKMLNAAFLYGFHVTTSKLLTPGYCIVVFMGLPNDSYWERKHDYFAKARERGALPTEMFAGFDKSGTVLLKPVEDLN